MRYIIWWVVFACVTQTSIRLTDSYLFWFDFRTSIKAISLGFISTRKQFVSTLPRHNNMYLLHVEIKLNESFLPRYIFCLYYVCFCMKRKCCEAKKATPFSMLFYVSEEMEADFWVNYHWKRHGFCCSFSRNHYVFSLRYIKKANVKYNNRYAGD